MTERSPRHWPCLIFVESTSARWLAEGKRFDRVERLLGRSHSRLQLVMRLAYGCVSTGLRNGRASLGQFRHTAAQEGRSGLEILKHLIDLAYARHWAHHMSVRAALRVSAVG